MTIAVHWVLATWYSTMKEVQREVYISEVMPQASPPLVHFEVSSG